MEQERLHILRHRAKKVSVDVNAKKGSLDNLYDLRAKTIQEKEDLEKKEALMQKTMALFKTLSEAENEKSKQVFVRLINFGLNAIFGEGIKFSLERKDYATGTFYSPVLVKNGVEEDLFSSGGGVLDMVSFLARIVLITAFYKKEQRVLRLDEPFKYLSAKYRPKAIELIQQLSETFGVQIIMITHDPAFAQTPNATVYNVGTNEQGYSTYTKLPSGV